MYKIQRFARGDVVGSYNITVKAARYAVWLMISTLVYLIAWIIGFAAEKTGLYYAFQANTYRHRRVLSFFYLGCQIFRKKIEIPILLREIQEAWDDLAWNIYPFHLKILVFSRLDFYAYGILKSE